MREQIDALEALVSAYREKYGDLGPSYSELMKLAFSSYNESEDMAPAGGPSENVGESGNKETRKVGSGEGESGKAEHTEFQPNFLQHATRGMYTSTTSKLSFLYCGRFISF